jgi:hypothetical protein
MVPPGVVVRLEKMFGSGGIADGEGS